MALTPLLYRLPASARTAYPLIVRGTRAGLSTRQIAQSIRNAGLPISESSITPLRNELLQQIEASQRIRRVRRNTVIDTEQLAPASTNIRREFSYVVRVRGTDPGGNLIERRTTVSTDRNTLTRGEIEDIARQSAEEDGQSETLDNIQVTLEEGRRRLRI